MNAVRRYFLKGISMGIIGFSIFPSASGQTDGLKTLEKKRLQYIMDRIQIQDTISRYAVGQDSHQGDDVNILNEWNETFTEDAQVDYSVTGVPVCSYRELAKWMRGDATKKGVMNANFSRWQ